ncbi:DurN family substrate-assisted peptide maturase [Streptomonospora nanhaiensis]|uniref:Uncharacterized protein n=1 Tax=Streptomonospora nanhaiensis TaxID=1323731 RepID=A0A853BJU6_9ACTN|nr:DurN family substrate-assisted peptide maturase [Streptomonospora nanhaiensis]MBV2365643.1 hypothetical protein [Streptomonospora nanhaiensis]MBX9389033.1 hypothetical protein [Streptomonospora nanhaiensis]NYI95543.1 hypothetical protein [Streptomonospora nanhaiensis]
MSAKGPTIYEGVDTIRRIQQLVVLCSLLPPDGKLRELLETALAVHEEPLLAHVGPVPDLHPHAVKGWLESFWLRDDITPEERQVVDWQSDSDNMGAAMRELSNVEQQTGMRLIAEKSE